MTIPPSEPTMASPKRSWRNIIIMIFAGVGFVVVACCVIAALVKKPTATTEVPPTPNKVTQATAAVAPVLDSNTEATAVPQPTVEAATSTALPPTETMIPVVAEVGRSRSNPVALNSEYRGEKWSFIITDVQRGAPAANQIKTANMFNDEAPQGSEYVLVTLNATNISTEDKAEDVLFAIDLHLTGSNNRLYSAVSVVPPKPFEGALFPKGSIEGQRVFLVPSDEKNLMFVVKESFTMTAPLYVALDENASVTVDQTAAMADTTIGMTRDTPAAANTLVVVNPVAITVDEVIRGADAATMVKKANQFNQPAPAGFEYICIRVTLKYLGDADPDSTYNTFFAGNEWRLIGSKNVLYDAPSIVAPDPQFSGMNTDGIYAGAQITGWIVRSAASDDTQLVLQYQPTFDIFDAHTRYIVLP